MNTGEEDPNDARVEPSAGPSTCHPAALPPGQPTGPRSSTRSSGEVPNSVPVGAPVGRPPYRPTALTVGASKARHWNGKWRHLEPIWDVPVGHPAGRPTVGQKAPKVPINSKNKSDPRRQYAGVLSTNIPGNTVSSQNVST